MAQEEVAAAPLRRRPVSQQQVQVGTAPLQPLVPPEYPERVKKEYDVSETFGLNYFVRDASGNIQKDANGKPVRRSPKIMGYADRTPWVPEIDPGYEFPEEDTKIALMGLATRQRVLVHGHSGVGKTTLIQQIAARLNYQVVLISLDGGITRPDLVGEWIVKGKEMDFSWGMLARAHRMPGTIILLDEWDAMTNDTAFVFQRPLDQNQGQLLVLETGGTLVPLHPDNTYFATANTRGLGDESGHYAGTKVQNYAQLKRFSLTISLGYLDEAKEIKMLRRRFEGKIEPLAISYLVKAAGKIRKAYQNGEISVPPLSHRDLINWANTLVSLGNPLIAAKYCFLNQMPPADATVVEGVVQRAFAPTP